MHTFREMRSTVLLVVAGLVSLAATAVAQTSTGSIRGRITDAQGTAVSEAQVIVRDLETNVQRSATSSVTGYYFLAGLRPSRYELTVRRLGFTPPPARSVQVSIGQTLDIDLQLQQAGVQLGGVQVTASPIETRTSEVATNVSTRQLENLPTPSRNFLDLAQLAPGVSVTEDRVNAQFRTFQAGGQPPSNVNVFVDGTSLKNDLTAGGVSGQDASRGNPFPRSAIQEYRVIAQNFKAEYQKASSAIITATTKTGSNEVSGNVLFTFQNQGMVGLDSFQRADKKAQGAAFKRPDYSRTLAALSIGGPIIRDKWHYFASYEGNYQNRNNRVAFPAIPSGFPALDTVALGTYNGQFSSPFRETLLYGKTTYAINNNSSAEVSVSNRHETDVRDFGAGRSLQSAVNFRQDVTMVQTRHNFFSGPWLNEAKLDYSRFQRKPEAATAGLPGRIFQLPGGDARIGSDFSTQDFVQSRIGLRNDVTYSGLSTAGQHVIKGGASLDFNNYDILKDNDGTPRFLYREINNGQTYNYATPYQVIYGTGDPAIKTNNTEFGTYIQDDWTPIRRLTVNAGVRWDFESNMLNKDYVTPQNVLDTLMRYNSQLPHPLDLERYVANGSRRKPFYGAVQPRLGFSYALDDQDRTTLSAGWGLYYDRVLFDWAVDEKLKISHPSYTVDFAPRGVTPLAGQVAWNDTYLTTNRAILDPLVTSVGKPEAWFIANDAAPTKSTHFNVGVRQLLRDWAATISYVGERTSNMFTLNWAQFAIDPATGRCCVSFDIGAHGFSNFIYSANDGKVWYDAVNLVLERPYQQAADARSISWGGGLSWNHGKRELQGVDNSGEVFAFPNSASIPRHPSNDEKDRVVLNWILDFPYLSGFQFSGIANFGGKYRLDVGCPARFCGEGTTGNQYQRGGYTVPGTFPYQNVDVRLRKDFRVPGAAGGSVGILFDVFNTLNHDNFGCYRTGNRDEMIGTVRVFGEPSCTVTDARRYQLGAEYRF